MKLNNIIFPHPSPSYSARSHFGNIIYIPKGREYSIGDIQSCRNGGKGGPGSVKGQAPSPTSTANGGRRAPKNFTFGTSELGSNSAKEESFYENNYIPCLFLPFTPGATKILIFFHGNAEDVGTTYEFLSLLRSSLRIHILAVEYPGYGIYEGSASANSIQEDALTIYNFVSKVMGIKGTDIIIFGRSIGSGPATFLACHKRINCLLLMSPYTSIRAVVKDLFGNWAKYLVAERFRNIDNIRNVKAPIFMVHGLRDDLIPYRHAQELCERTTQTTHLVLPTQMDHNYFDFKDDLLTPLKRFFRSNQISTKPTPANPGAVNLSQRLFVKPILGNDKKTPWFRRMFKRA